MRHLMLIALACTCILPVSAQSKPCGPEYHLFDFWIGEWEVFAAGKKAGENHIVPILDGCLLQETWTSTQGIKGTSLSYYDPQTHKWNQYWVWQNGTPLGLLVGEFKDRKMVLANEVDGPSGTKVHNRVTWTHNQDDTVQQVWETSGDGTSWRIVFDGLYKKKAS